MNIEYDKEIHIRKHKILSSTCLIFILNALVVITNLPLYLTYLALTCTSVLYHQSPKNKLFFVMDQIAVFNLIYQNAILLYLCPTWLVYFFIITVTYSACWFYPAKLGYVQDKLHLPLHLTTHILSSICGIFVAMHALG